MQIMHAVQPVKLFRNAQKQQEPQISVCDASAIVPNYVVEKCSKFHDLFLTMLLINNNNNISR